MKHFYFFLILLALPIGTQAQSKKQTKAQWNYSIELGASFNNFVCSDAALSATGSEVQVGFKIAALASYTTRFGLVAETGLGFNSNMGGAIYSISPTEFKHIDNIRTTMQYLQLPINIGYKIKLADKLSLTPKVGLWGAVGVGGHSMVSGVDYNGNAYVNRIDSFTDDTFKVGNGNDLSTVNMPGNGRFDWGVGIGLELQSGNIIIKGTCDLGLVNMNKELGGYNTLSYSLTVGYKF